MARESKQGDARNYSPLVTVLWGGVACGMVALAALASLFWWEFLTPLNQRTVKTLPQTQGQSQPSQPGGGTTPAPAPDTAPQQDPADSGQPPPVEPDAGPNELDTAGSDDAAAQPPGVEEPESQQPDAPLDQPPASQEPQDQPVSGKGQNTTSSSAGTSGGKADIGSSSNQSGLVLNPSNGNDTGAGAPSAPADNSGGAGNSNSGDEQAGGETNSSGSSSSGTWGDISTTDEITGSLDQTSYWTKGGKSYHFSLDCPSLSQSTNIQTGTLQDALDAKKTDPCNHCAGGS